MSASAGQDREPDRSRPVSDAPDANIRRRRSGSPSASGRASAGVIPAPDPDAELVAQWQAGDLGAFERLVRRHERRVFRLLYRMLGSREEAEDATQEAFLSLHRHGHRFRARGALLDLPLPGRRQCRAEPAPQPRPRARTRRRARAAARSSATRDRRAVRDPEAAAHGVQVQHAVQQALLELPPDLRVAVVLFDIEGRAVQGDRRRPRSSGGNREVAHPPRSQRAAREPARLPEGKEGGRAAVRDMDRGSTAMRATASPRRRRPEEAREIDARRLVAPVAARSGARVGPDGARDAASAARSKRRPQLLRRFGCSGRRASPRCWPPASRASPSPSGCSVAGSPAPTRSVAIGSSRRRAGGRRERIRRAVSGAASRVTFARYRRSARRRAVRRRSATDAVAMASRSRASIRLLDRRLDAQLNELQLDPHAFLRRLERVRERERFVQRLAERAARRGDAAQVALSVRAVPHALARPHGRAVPARVAGPAGQALTGASREVACHAAAVRSVECAAAMDRAASRRSLAVDAVLAGWPQGVASDDDGSVARRSTSSSWSRRSAPKWSPTNLIAPITGFFHGGPGYWYGSASSRSRRRRRARCSTSSTCGATSRSATSSRTRRRA